jgi:hypothetical protein
MSLQTPISVQLQRPKAYFYFYSPLQTVFDSPKVSDTTSVSTTSTTRTTAKTYTINIPSPGNRIRVIVYGYVTQTPNTMTVYLSIDGVDVASASTGSGTETIVLDYNGEITSGVHNIRVDFLTSTGREVYITKVYIATGIGLTSTTLTDLITFSVTYQLVRSGDIRYSPGIRVFVYGNRKTTATTTLQVGSSPTVGRNQLGAGNNNTTPEVFLAIVTGSVTLQEGGEFTVSATLRGNVGASGDVVIITRIQARAQLRRESNIIGEVRVYERGVAEYFARALLVSVPSGSTSTAHNILRRDILDEYIVAISISSAGADVTVHNYRVAVVAPIHFVSGSAEDYYGEAFIEWVQVVVLG